MTAARREVNGDGFALVRGLTFALVADLLLVASAAVTWFWARSAWELVLSVVGAAR